MTKEELVSMQIGRPDEGIRKKVQANWDAVAKPLDGMGAFESIVADIGAIRGDESVDITRKAVIVMCADNGIVEEGVSQSGQEVTAAVAASMGRQESSVCRMAKVAGAKVIPVDIGIAGAQNIAHVLDKKVARGTANFLHRPAMTEQQALSAVAVGMELVQNCKKEGFTLLATGEMGIGNTTTCSAMAAALLGLTAEQVTGRGAGLSDERLKKKIAVIREALIKYQFGQGALETFRILQSVGGLDIAGLVGVFLGGAGAHIPVVMDGVISAVAALTAERLVPGVRHYVIPSHRSREPAAARIMEELDMHPVIDAGLALGEGTGAVMMFGLLDMACETYREHTSFADIAVEPYRRYPL